MFKLISATLLAALLTACSTTPGSSRMGRAHAPEFGPPPTTDEARACVILDGATGAKITYAEVLERIAASDAVILGETHNDGMGHAFQAAIVEDMIERWPRTALCMEMLERDEQGLVYDYLEDVIDADTFVERTNSINWGARGMFPAWYLPMIDAAKARYEDGAMVVAANAPRRYVRMARTDGYERLEAMGPPRRAWFDVPIRPSDEKYFDRFRSVMQGVHETPSEEWTEEDEEGLVASFRSQSMWDATMGASMARALDDGAEKAVLLIGQFHSDFGGGTVQQMKNARPGTRTLLISLQPDSRSELVEEDDGRADVVVMTGG